jgi:hypothetical protein
MGAAAYATAPGGGRKAATMEFRILGPLEARDRGHALMLGSGRPSALLAVLLLHAGASSRPTA